MSRLMIFIVLQSTNDSLQKTNSNSLGLLKRKHKEPIPTASVKLNVLETKLELAGNLVKVAPPLHLLPKLTALFVNIHLMVF